MSVRLLLLILLSILSPLAASAPDAQTVVDLAEGGDASAQLLLGLAYLRGDWKLPRSASEGARCLENSALAGNGYAQERVAELYERGLGVPQSPTLTADWREVAAQTSGGHLLHSHAPSPAEDDGYAHASRPFPELQWLIDQVKDAMQAMEARSPARHTTLAKLAADGDAEAQFALGYSYESEKHDKARAAAWYERAAGARHAEAMQRLAALKAIQGNSDGADTVSPGSQRTDGLRSASADLPIAAAAAVAPLADIASDLFALIASASMVAAYYLFLWRMVRVDPTYTIHGVNQLARRLWVLNVMRNSSKDVMAVQTLRNFIMGASLMASTATLLIIGTLTLSGQADSISRSWQVLNMHGSHAAELWVVKVLALLITFIVAFFAFAMCVRLTNHVLFMLNVAEQDAHHELSPDKVAMRLNRAGSLFAIGMRAFFVAIPLAFWLFGPTFLLLASVGLVFSLHRLDRSRVGRAS